MLGVQAKRARVPEADISRHPPPHTTICYHHKLCRSIFTAGSSQINSILELYTWGSGYLYRGVSERGLGYPNHIYITRGAKQFQSKRPLGLQTDRHIYIYIYLGLGLYIGHKRNRTKVPEPHPYNNQFQSRRPWHLEFSILNNRRPANPWSKKKKKNIYIYIYGI